MLAGGSPEVGLGLAVRWGPAEEADGSLRCSDTSLSVGGPLAQGLWLDAFSL